MSAEQSKIDELLREPSPPPEGHLTEFRLEHLTLHDRRDPEGRAHLAKCPECQKRLAEIQAEREAFLRSLPAEKVLASTPRRARRGFWIRRLSIAAAAAIAASVLVIWIVPRQETGVFVKGQVALNIFACRGESRWQVTSNEGFLPGDALRLQIFSQRHGYIRVLARVGSEISHAIPDPEREPDQFDLGIPIDKAQWLTLAGSLILDEETRREWLVVLLSPDPLSSQAAETIVRTLTRGQLERGGVPFETGQTGVTAIPFEITRESAGGE